jgi:transcriptional regulator with XRE-family HTH domain
MGAVTLRFRGTAVAEKTRRSKAWQPVLGADPARLRQLGDLLRRRRAALGWRDRPAFEEDQDINQRLISDIERGRRDTYTFPTLQDIAAAYEVTYESMTAVAWSDAGELVPAPVPAEAEEPRALTPAPPDDRPAPGWPPERVAADRPYFDRINERRVELASRGIVYPTGAQMFPDDPDDAAAWDGPGARLPVGDRVWFIADLRRLEAARGAGPQANDRGA